MRATWRSLTVVLLAMAGVVLLAVSGTMASLVSLVVATTTAALIMGGTGNPSPTQPYLGGQTTNYITPFFTVAGSPEGVYTPEQFWPLDGSTLTFDESVSEGVGSLGNAIQGRDNLVVLGYSQSTRIASITKRGLIEEHGTDFDSYPTISFVLVSNVNKGNGGILERFKGLYIPILGVSFDGSTPTDSPENPGDPGDHALDTKDITFIHDGWSDFPIYPGNLLAVGNALLGIAYLHGTYPNLTDPELIEQGSYGDTDYYVIGTDIVPLLMPLEQIGVPKPILLAVDEPLRVMIEAGYRRDINPGVPTTAYLIPVNNPVKLTVNLALSIPVGLDDAAQDMGMGRPLGTQPSGPYGVGGDDADLAGLPPGFIPLGQTTSPQPAGTLTSLGHRESETTLAQDLSTPQPVGEPTPGVQRLDADADEQDDPQTGSAADGTDTPAAPTPKRPKPLRPKVRGPITFDRPTVSLSRPAGDRPLKRVIDTLTGQRPKASETGESGGADQPKTAGDKDAA